jgi:hypothetical protein
MRPWLFIFQAGSHPAMILNVQQGPEMNDRVSNPRSALKFASLGTRFYSNLPKTPIELIVSTSGLG